MNVNEKGVQMSRINVRSLLGLVMAGNQVIRTRARWIHCHSTRLTDVMSIYQHLS